MPLKHRNQHKAVAVSVILWRQKKTFYYL